MARLKAGLILGLLLAVLAGWVLWMPANKAAHLHISAAMIQPLEGGGAVATLQMENDGAPDRLLSVQSSGAKIDLYAPLSPDALAIPTGASGLALDGAHIRVDNANHSLQEGALLPLTLVFEEAGEVHVKARYSDPAQMGEAEKVGLFGLGGICRVEDGEPAPEISLNVTPKGAGWQVEIEARDFTFSKEFLGLYHVPGMGHAHLYVGGLKLGRLFSSTGQIGALPKGRHEVRVTLNTNDHRAYVVGDEPVTATAIVTVE